MEKKETKTIELVTLAGATNNSIILGIPGGTMTGYCLIVAKGTVSDVDEYASYRYNVLGSSMTGGQINGGGGSTGDFFANINDDNSDGTLVVTLDNSSGTGDITWLVRYELLIVT